MPSFTAKELRANLDRNAELLRKHPDAAYVVTVASNVVKDISPVLLRQAKALPVVRKTPFSVVAPQNRTPEFNEALEALVGASYAALDEITKHESRVAANADLTRDECRGRALEHLKAAGRSYVWASDMSRELSLSYGQILDALEQLDYEGLLEGQKQDFDDDPAWRVRLNVNGRNVAEGRQQSSMFPVSLVHQEFHSGSQAAVVGANFGHVVQNITAFPVMPADLRATLQETEDGAAFVRALDDANEARAKPSILKGIVTGIKTFIEGANSQARSRLMVTNGCKPLPIGSRPLVYEQRDFQDAAFNRSIFYPCSRANGNAP